MTRRLLTVVACLLGLPVLAVGLRGASPVASPWQAPAGRSTAVDDRRPRGPLTFRLLDTAGVTHTEREIASAAAVVLFFITPDCPISQSYVPEMNRIAAAYTSRGVRVFAVQADTTTTDDEARRHAVEYGYQFPMLVDRSQRLTAYTPVTVTPEAVVLTGTGTIRYWGRIDNRVVNLGTKRVQATEFDLRNALDAVLAGRPVTREHAPAYGCLISRPS